MTRLACCCCYIFVLASASLLLITNVSCYQYKVGDMDSWGIPSSANPGLYTTWSKHHSPRIGDSLFFFYPPSQDSLIQVTKQSYDSCNLKDPILNLDDGNSLFNITSYGDFYFTSGVAGHCEKNQKLHVRVLSASGNGLASSPVPTALPDYAPSYPTVFGTIPVSESSSTISASPLSLPLLVSTILAGLVLCGQPHRLSDLISSHLP